MKFTTTYKLLLIAIVFLCSFSAFAQPPSISCPGFQTTNLPPPPGICYYTHSGTEWDATATGVAPIALTYTLTGATTTVTISNTTLSGQIFNKGLTSVLWTATDGAGATATCTFNVLTYPPGVQVVFNPILPVYGPATVDLTDPAITAGSYALDNNCVLCDITFRYYSNPDYLPIHEISEADAKHIHETGRYYIKGVAINSLDGSEFSGQNNG